MKEITLYFLLLLVSEADPPFLTYKGYDAYYTKQQCIDLGEQLKKNLESLSVVTEKKIIEIGPNKVLSGLIRRISTKFDITSYDKISDL